MSGMRCSGPAARRHAALLLVAAGAMVSACQPTGAPAEASAPADLAAGELPMRFMGAQDAALVVDVFINGEGPFDLVLDTGATYTCVTHEVAERLQLPERRGAVGIGAGVGGAGQVQLVRFDSLRVGAATVTDMPGCVLDLSALEAVGTRIDGLLGLNFLRSFDVRLDFAREVVTLTSP
jgi:predicted aspartyl protease